MDKKQIKGIVFIAFYIVFFYFIFSQLVSIKKSQREVKENGKNKNSMVNINKILNNNYSYSYNINVDGDIYSFVGSLDKDKERFLFNNINYYRNKDNYYDDSKGFWSVSINPNKYYYLTSKNIKEILSNATYLYKVKNEEGVVHHLQISTNSLVKIFMGTTIDIDDVPNKIEYITDTAFRVVRIVYDLSSYSKYMKLGNKFIVDLKYDNLGYVKIINPLDKK